MSRKPYPSDLSQEEWEFVAPYPTLMKEDAPQREHSSREVFNALRWLARAGAPWRMLPNDFPPWAAVYQQFRRWSEAGCFEAMVSDMRSIIRAGQGRQGQPSAVVLDGRTLQSSVESGERAGYDGYKRRKGSKVHMAVDTLGNLIDLTVTSADEQERSQVKALCQAVQQATGETVEVAWADQGYTGQQASQDAKASGIELRVVKLPEARKGFVLLPRRWVVERSFAWLARFRRLSRDFERMPQVLAALHFLVFATLMLPKAVMFLATGESA
ncbi:IS5 family transposase [Azohydromonas lata]|uniref:IS5 family transposase n=1 Tax=Azohydromonas lata TaxID=45677 RepID=A0ABU5I8P6_9BURK|nr:IS5 family transposase [Azohydromonas lata]MDZ5455025.1 IS5 family transposase [Azohydromonas lata]